MASIQARITNVVRAGEDSDWIRIETDHERIKRLDTKLTEKAYQARELQQSGDLVEIEYSERESTNINPYNNRPYLNRYYENAVPISGRELDIPTAEGPSEFQRRTNPIDAWRMCLNKGAELAVLFSEQMREQDRTIEKQKLIAIEWAEFFLFTPVPEQPSQNGSFRTPAGVGRGNPGAYGDDDIPF